ncbi:hypothetical protein [Subtercola boreus]|uniref:hypothetical protein n=1 Tax=Subtercola boreus TaxID=120213 RepID=UPI0011C058CB|nr:hypothetical protein [Subtercola boreus]
MELERAVKMLPHGLIVVFCGSLFLSGCAGEAVADQPGSASALSTSGVPPTSAEPTNESLDCTTEANRRIPTCTGEFLPGVAPTPGQAVIDERTAISIAVHGYGSPEGSPAAAKLITYAEWVGHYGGGTTSQIEDSRPVWVVVVSQSTTNLRQLGPPGSTIPAASGYTVLLDGYSSVPIELVYGELKIT